MLELLAHHNQPPATNVKANTTKAKQKLNKTTLRKRVRGSGRHLGDMGMVLICLQFKKLKKCKKNNHTAYNAIEQPNSCWVMTI